MSEILNILSSVGFNWHVALANFVNFLIILFLLNKFFFKKIGKVISERHKIIEHGLNQAHEAEIRLSQAHEEKKSIIQAANQEKDEIVAKGEALAHANAEAIQHEAQKEISSRLAKLHAEELALTEKVQKSFQEQAPVLVAELYRKTILKELTEEDNNSLISRMTA